VSPQALSEALAPLWTFLNRRSSSELFTVLADLNSSFSQMKMLYLLEDGAEHSITEIAAALGLSVPAASRAVDGLLEKGYVARRESDEDRRSRLIRLSERGRQAADSVRRARLRALNSFSEGLSEDERRNLYDAVLPIVERIARQ
jgi:DNA-binding MarR family transcriptional regulator